jgi:predicted transcriptional regulator
MTTENDTLTISEMTTRIVSAYVSHNRVEPDQVSQLIQSVAQDLKSLETGQQETSEATTQPAVNPRKSVGKDHLVCLVCGRKQKALKRHLSKAHGLTPEGYREMFGLRADYPMVAPSTSRRRSEIARSIGLGRREEDREETRTQDSRAA